MIPIDTITTAAEPTEADVHAQLLAEAQAAAAPNPAPADPPPGPQGSEPATDPAADPANPTDPTDPPAEDPPAADAPNPVLDELRAMRAELAELKAAKAAEAQPPAAPANPTEAASTLTLAQIDAEERQTWNEIRYLRGKIAKGESHTEPNGQEYSPDQMEAMVLDREERLRFEIPKARAAAQSTTSRRTTVEAEVRKSHPTQFVPGTPAHAMNAPVAGELKHLAHLPDFPRIVADIVVGRLAARNIKPAPAAKPPHLPTGSATRPPVTGSNTPPDSNAQLAALQKKYPNGDIPEEELVRLM